MKYSNLLIFSLIGSIGISQASPAARVQNPSPHAVSASHTASRPSSQKKHSPTKEPKWMCYSIAGYILRYDPTHGDTAVKDTASPYVLIRTVDCDGASITLCLSKEMDDLESVGLGPQSISSAKFDSDGRTAKKDKLRSLSTGAGVSIGDSQATVIKKLGKPTSRNKSTTVSGGTDFCYEYHPHAPQSGPYFEEDYTFKNGKLVRIEFSRSETD